MAARDSNLSFLVTSRVYRDVSDLTAASPYGGTELGIAGSIAFASPSGVVYLTREEDNQPEAVMFTGGSTILAMSFESYDVDVLATIFPNVANGATGPVTTFGGGILDPGQKLSKLTNLLVTPINPDHPSLLLYTPTPHFKSTAAISFSAREFLGFPSVFIGTPNVNSASAVMGQLSDLAGIL